MKRYLILPFIVLSLFIEFSCSQNPNVDKKHNENSNIDKINNKCLDYLQIQDYQRAIQAGREAIRLYPSDPSGYFCLGVSYFQIGELDLAITYFKKTEEYASDKSDLMWIYNLLGRAYLYKDMLEDALLYFNKALSLAKDLGDKDSEATTLTNIALVYSVKGELDKALSYFEESLKLATNEKDKSEIYASMATIIYIKQRNYQKAIEYLKKVMDIYERYGDYHGYAIGELSLGAFYMVMKDYQNAEKYLLDGLTKIQKVGDKYWEGNAYQYLGRLYRDKGEKALARDYLNKALKIFTEIGASGKVNEVKSNLKDLNASQ